MTAKWSCRCVHVRRTVEKLKVLSLLDAELHKKMDALFGDNNPGNGFRKRTKTELRSLLKVPRKLSYLSS